MLVVDPNMRKEFEISNCRVLFAAKNKNEILIYPATSRNKEN